MRGGIPEERRAKSEGREIFFLSLVLLVLACSFLSSQASAQENNDYEQLIERNLELRQKLKAMEEKYTALENERNVLILHVRNLQEEKKRLADSIGEKGEESIHYPELKTAFSEVSKELGIVVQERDVLKKELLPLKKQQEAGEERIKILESEKAELAGELNTIKILFKETQDKSTVILTGLETEKANLSEQINRFKEAFAKEKADILAQGQKAAQEAKAEGRKESEAALKALEQEKEKQTRTMDEQREGFLHEIDEMKKVHEENQLVLGGQFQDIQEKSRQLEKELAIKQAFHQAQEEQLKAEHQNLVPAYEGLKRDVRQLTQERQAIDERLQKMSQEKETAQGKWRQAEGELKSVSEDLKNQQKLLAKRNKLISIEKRRWEKKNAGLIKGKEAAEKRNQEAQGAREAAEARVKTLEKELEAQQGLHKQQTALVEKLKMDKSALEKEMADKAKKDASLKTEGLFGSGRRILTLADKQSLDIHYNLALAYHQTKMYKAEEQEYLKCLKIDPDDAYVHYNLAILYDDKFNDNARAIRHYRKYLDLSPLGEDAEKVKVWMLHAEQDFRMGKQLR